MYTYTHIHIYTYIHIYRYRRIYIYIYIYVCSLLHIAYRLCCAGPSPIVAYCLLSLPTGYKQRGPLGLNKHCAQAICIVYNQKAVYSNIAMYTCCPRVSACCPIAC